MKRRFLGSSNLVPRSVRWAIPRPLRSRLSIFSAFHSIRAFQLRFLPGLSAALSIDALTGASNGAFYRSFYYPKLGRAALERIGKRARIR